MFKSKSRWRTDQPASASGLGRKGGILLYPVFHSTLPIKSVYFRCSIPIVLPLLPLFTLFICYYLTSDYHYHMLTIIRCSILPYDISLPSIPEDRYVVSIKDVDLYTVVL